jgi:antitoxin component HigA of HigAB toxin-antitoxin module
MTADEWDSSTNLDAMRNALHQLHIRGTRKWYCYALGCVRLIEDELPARCRKAIEATEQYVDRRATNNSRALARAALVKANRSAAEEAAYWASAAPTDIVWAGRVVPVWVTQTLSDARGGQVAESARQECTRLLREVFGNPFRPAHVEPEWLRWGDGAVRKIAETINDEGDFARVAVLADALEDAGCTDERILAHLRDPGPHVRGCWVIDVILGKK